jgi:N-hydroxyarylamine O-acetyltransferase
VTRRRGGYCYEHGLLFGAALERLGFEVRRALARVGGEEADPARARTHMALRVRADGSWWLADVGFGAGLLAPILLADGEEQRQGDWTFRVRADGDGRWTLLERRDDWAPLYAFDEQPQHVADVFVANYYTSTHPNSPFVGKAVAVRKDEHALYELIDGRLTTTRPGRPPEHRDLTDAEITDALRDRFGVVVGDAVGPAPTGT